MVEGTLVSERENILERIREALTLSAPVTVRQGYTLSSVSPRPWLPAVGDAFRERLGLFERNATDLKADFQLLKNQAELEARIKRLREAGGWKRVASHKGELTGAAAEAAAVPVLWTDSAYDVNELEVCDAGITECDALIAQTGSVLVTSRSAGGRALSVLPPHHVVIAKREQLLPDLLAAFELLKKKYGADYPSLISFITGPSRTGDIERILVLGAHGPRKLTILCV
jgi:L-lactate dehydrogenase complex protein LldG